MSKITNTMIAHMDFEDFEYDLLIDWAIELLEENIVTESIQMAAGLNKPVNVFEAREYIDKILEELNIPKYEKRNRIKMYCRQYIYEISEGNNIRINLSKLGRICINLDYDKEIYDFCSLNWAWGDLDYQEYQYYWPNATRENIEKISKGIARKWIVDYEEGRNPTTAST